MDLSELSDEEIDSIVNFSAEDAKAADVEDTAVEEEVSPSSEEDDTPPSLEGITDINEIPMEVVEFKSNTYCVLQTIMTHSETLIFEGWQDDESLEMFEELLTVLSDEEVAQTLNVDTTFFNQIDIEYLKGKFEEYNQRIEQDEEVEPEDYFHRQMFVIARSFRQFHEEVVYRDPDVLIDQAAQYIEGRYPGLDARYRQVFQYAKDNPNVGISPTRIWGSHYRRYAVPGNELGDRLDATLSAEKIDALHRVDQLLPVGQLHGYSLEDKMPEIVRLMDCVYATAMGNEDLEKAIKSGQKNPEGYIYSEFGEKNVPHRGLKVHVPVDLLSPDMVGILETVADTAREHDTYGMKVQRYTYSGANRDNPKGITIYPNMDEGKSDINDPTANFHNALRLARHLDEELMRFQKEHSRPYSTDLPIGESNLVTIRFCELRTLGEDETPYENAWEDDREKTFEENFPDPSLIATAQEVAQEFGLDIDLANQPVRAVDIENAKSLEELTTMLRSKGALSTRDRYYPGTYLADKVDEFARGEAGPSVLTSTYDLRKKATELKSQHSAEAEFVPA